jgi:hypothetical protein
MALPNLFIIGAAKAGTTSLHYYLDQHPQVQMSVVKEPNFFSGAANGNAYPMGRVAELGEYEALFDPAYEVRGEASVGYTNAPRREGVPAAIKELVPCPKLVYLVRDPVARVVSQYQYRVAMEGERASLREALSDLSNPYSVYLCPSLYATQLELYLREFDQEDMLVLEQEELLHNRRSALCQVFDLLGVEKDVDFSVFEEELNVSGEKRAYSFGYVQFRERLKASPLRLLPRGFRQSLRRTVEKAMWKPLPPAVLDDDLRARLEDRLRPEAERLRGLTGKAFDSWTV